MDHVIEPTEWSTFLRGYSQRNEGKPTRIGVFEMTDGVANDYWIEDGLPLMGLDLYSEKGKPRVDIMFSNFTHSIDDVARLTRIGTASVDEGLDISDREGRTTQLRFEDWEITK